MHALVDAWFRERYGDPTDIQSRVWPVIAEGHHTLFTAPTGSGKTLAAFLYSLDRLLTGTWDSGAVTVLYVSPLKALNNDIQRNLLEPLQGLSERFRAEGLSPPPIRALTRSGDTPAEERRSMLRHPPEILITTPESLNILLTSRSGCELLGDVQKVILDEIHAVAGTKRGTHLMTAVERVDRLSRHELQRIAISATVRPLEGIARFVAGYEYAPQRRERPITVIESPGRRALLQQLEYPDLLAQTGEEDPSPWLPVVETLRGHLKRNRSTLIFTTNRRDAEKLAGLINEAEGRLCAYPHHGSLSQELRREVEGEMKKGGLEAIVATTSLELGIDIGSIDEVVLLRTPYSVSSALQMIGRSGHRVGVESRGSYLPFFPRDLLNAVVMMEALAEGDIEEIHPPEGALDVLAQVIVSMTAREEWPLDELYAFFRQSYPYRALDRRLFEGVIDMLAGRYADTHIRELEPRIYRDELSGTIRGRQGVERLLYHSGGTIPDRGYYELRVAGSEAKLGELDEEFVWERRLGDVFLFGNQKWKVREITDRGVRVDPASDASRALPFWKGEPLHRGFHWSSRLLSLLETLDGAPKAQIPGAALPEASISGTARQQLLDFLAEQREATAGLPHRHRVVVEETAGRHDRDSGAPDLVIHTLWGGRVNYPLGLLLRSALAGPEITSFANDDAVLIQGPPDLDGEQVLRALRSLAAGTGSLIDRLRQVLEESGFYAARFRENAGRSLLLPRAGFDRRTPLWLNRLRARSILSRVAEYPDFPVVLETWRTCLQDSFDLPALTQLLDEIAEGTIRLDAVSTTNPSPFARDLVWRETNVRMYEEDRGVAPSRISADNIRSALSAGVLDRQIPEDLIDETDARLKREEPDYAPGAGDELGAWVRSRVLIPEAEWERLLDAVSSREAEGGEGRGRILASLARRVCRIRLPGARLSGLTSIDRLPFLARLLPEPAAAEPGAAEPDGPETREGTIRNAVSPLVPEQDISGEVETAFVRSRHRDEDRGGAPEPAEERGRLLREFLGFYAAADPDSVATLFGALLPDPAGLLAEGRESGDLVSGHDPRDERRLCRSDVYEILLRRARRRSRRGVEPRPARLLPLFSALWQGLVTEPADQAAADRGEEGRERRSLGTLEQLSLLPLSPSYLEEEILPARLPDYRPSDLDDLLRRDSLRWLSPQRDRVILLGPEDLELAAPLLPGGTGEGGTGAAEIFPSPRGRFSFWDLQQESGLRTGELEERLYALSDAGLISADSLAPLRRRPAGGTASGRGDSPPEGGSPTAGASDPAGGGFPGPADSAAAAPRAWEPRRGRTGGRRGGAGGLRGRRGGGSPAAGAYWFPLERPAAPEGELEALEREKERARLVLDRHGIVFRARLRDEGAGFRWGELLNAFRLLELAGEVLGGYFLRGVPGLQFTTPEGLSLLQELEEAEPVLYALSAADPASPAGLGLEELPWELPARQRGTTMVFRGTELVLTAKRGGKDLEIALPPEDSDLPVILGFARRAVSRAVNPKSRYVVETVNGETASASTYTESLQRLGFRKDHRSLVLWARYR